MAVSAKEASSTVTMPGPKSIIFQTFVVGFHHQKGSTVEYSYPPLPNHTEHHTEADTEETPSITNFLPPEWKCLPFLALPDGCHNYEEDCVYFTLPPVSNSVYSQSPGQSGPVFGVACCKQVEVKDLAVVTKDITRSTVQKSVCVLSRYPVYGYIEAKLNIITRAYFNNKDFSNTAILQEAYETLNATLVTESLNEMVHVGLSPRDLLTQFHHRTLQVFKALILQKRVLVYGSSTSQVCSTVLSVASLFPNLLESLSTVDQQCLDENQFPLPIFPYATSLQPYLCLQQMELLATATSLSGVVNPLFEKQSDKLCDVFLNLSDGLLRVHDADLQACLRLTSADLRFCSLLDDTIQQTSSKETNSAHYSNWLGSDNWVRTQFKHYLIRLLLTTVKEETISISDFNSDFFASWLNGPVYSSWKSNYEKHTDVLKTFESGHICGSESGLSLGDVKRRLLAQASDYGLNKEHAIEEAQKLVSETTKRVSTAVGSMWTSASSTVYSWFTNEEKN